MSLAVVFSGQGSQHVGMLEDFATEKLVQQCFAEAQDILQQDLWQLCIVGPEESLNSTVNTQPALLTAGVALWRLWQAKGGEEQSKLPQYMTGHSLGEYTALVCAESIAFTDGLNLVRNRAKYMQMAMEQDKGAMAAILGLDYEAVQQICDDITASSYVYPANINSPKQIVISGYEAGVEAASRAAKKAGAKKTVPLPVSVPSHCALMQPAAELLAGDLEKIEIKPPKIPVVHNVDAKPAKDVQEIKEKLVWQLTKSVQWVDTINYISSQGVNTIIECGPKKVLTSLNRSINSELTLFAIGQSKQDFDSCFDAI